jgi:hypothetical protein
VGAAEKAFHNGRASTAPVRRQSHIACTYLFLSPQLQCRTLAFSIRLRGSIRRLKPNVHQLLFPLAYTPSLLPIFILFHFTHCAPSPFPYRSPALLLRNSWTLFISPSPFVRPSTSDSLFRSKELHDRLMPVSMKLCVTYAMKPPYQNHVTRKVGDIVSLHSAPTTPDRCWYRPEAITQHSKHLHAMSTML